MDSVLEIAKTEINELSKESESPASNPAYMPRAWDAAGAFD